MAFAYTVNKVINSGAMRKVYGSFTSAVGDNALSLALSVHGLNYIASAEVNLAKSAIDAHTPKVTISGSTVTGTFADTKGLSGTFILEGR